MPSAPAQLGKNVKLTFSYSHAFEIITGLCFVLCYIQFVVFLIISTVSESSQFNSIPITKETS